MVKRGCILVRKIFYFIILGELAVLLLFFIGNVNRIMPGAEYSSEDLITAGENKEGLKIDEGNGALDGTDEKINKRIVSPDTKLKQGIYQIDVFYNSEIPAGSTSGIHAQAAADQEPAWIYSEAVMLADSSDHVSWRIYVKKDNTCVKVKAVMDEECQMSASVSRIVITPLEGRTGVVRTIKLLLAFLFTDAVCLGIFYRKKLVSVKKETLLTAAGLCLLVFLLELPMTMDYLPKGYDMRFHYYRIYSIAAGLQEGVLPVKVQPEWVNGYGYATGIFYGDILLYLPALMYAAGFSMTAAYKVYVLLINLLTVMGSYACFKSIGKGRIMGISGCILYSFSLHRLVAVYTRAALGAFSAMAFLPFIVLGLWKIYYGEEKRKYDWIYLVIGISGILETHVLGTMMAMGFILIFALISFRKTFTKEVLAALVKAAGVTVLLNLFFILPFLDEYISMQLKIQGEYRPVYQYSAYVSQLFTNVYNAVGDVRADLTGMLHDMPMTVGPASLVVLAGAAAALLFLKEKKNRVIIIKILSLITLALWISTNLFPYRWLEVYANAIFNILMKFEFAWRFQAAAALLIPLLFVLLLRFGRKYLDNKKLLAAGGTVCILFLWQGMNYIFEYNDSMIPFEHETDFRDLSQGAVYNGQYLPEGFSEDKTDPEIRVSDAEDIKIALREKGKLKFKVDVTDKTKKEAYIELPLIPYKGYKAQTQKGNLIITQGINSRMRVMVPAGFKGSIHVYFEEPWYWRTAEIISLMTLMVIFFFCFIKKFFIKMSG